MSSTATSPLERPRLPMAWCWPRTAAASTRRQPRGAAPSRELEGMPSVKPLKDVTVLEIGHSIAAPYAGMILGELGATVAKLENPRTGAYPRDPRPPFAPAPPTP